MAKDKIDPKECLYENQKKIIHDQNQLLKDYSEEMKEKNATIEKHKEYLVFLNNNPDEKQTPEVFFVLALAKFQSEMPTIERNKVAKFPTKKGGWVEFKYADLAQIWDKMKKPLTKYGFSVMQPIQHEEGTNYLYTILSHCEGKSVQSKMRLDCIGDDIKGMGSAITYYRRYAVCSLLGLVSDDDVDEAQIPDGESPYEKSLTTHQLKIIEDTLSDAPGLRKIIVSSHGDLNKIPEANFNDVLKAIMDAKKDSAAKDFLRKYGMNIDHTEYHDYIDHLSDETGRDFNFILDKAVGNEDEFIEEFNKWKQQEAETKSERDSSVIL